MAINHEERQKLQDLFDVYDLIEILDLEASDIIDSFEDQIEANVEIMERIGSL